MQAQELIEILKAVQKKHGKFAEVAFYDTNDRKFNLFTKIGTLSDGSRLPNRLEDVTDGTGRVQIPLDPEIK